MQAKITRLNIAHSDHEGKKLCKRWLQGGLFTCGKSEPDRKLLDASGSVRGLPCTLTIESKKKCFADTKKQATQYPEQHMISRIGEMARERSRNVTPLDTLTEPGKYLAGSFPALAFISAVQDKIRPREFARDGALPSCKVGKAWIFVDDLLIGHLVT